MKTELKEIEGLEIKTEVMDGGCFSFGNTFSNIQTIVLEIRGKPFIPIDELFIRRAIKEPETLKEFLELHKISKEKALEILTKSINK